MKPADLIDQALEQSVVLGFSSIGYGLRRRLANWPGDPAPYALEGREIAVTGASSGLGQQTALELSKLGATVHLVVRDLAKGERVAASLPGPARVWLCDLADLDSVRRFAGAFDTPLDGLVHNAGVMPPQRSESPQGFELSMAVHVLGPVLMTDLLVQRGMMKSNAQVMLVTSGGMYLQALPVRDPDYCHGEYKPALAYARSKRAQVELLPLLAEQWPHLVVTAMHPGWAKTPGVTDSMPGFDRLVGPILRTPAQGCDTAVWLLDPKTAPASGTLWHDRRPRATHRLGRTETSPSDRAEFWQWVQDAIGDYRD